MFNRQQQLEPNIFIEDSTGMSMNNDATTTLIKTTASGDAETVLTTATTNNTMTTTNNSNGQLSSQSNDTEMVDFTSCLEECASSLTYTDPLLSTPSFSLLDSMAALELMDPSMDCCEISSSRDSGSGGTTTKEEEHDRSASSLSLLRQAPSGLDHESSPLPWDELTLNDAFQIGLEALACLEAMLGGASVAESTYTCLYAHDAVLRDMKTRMSPLLSSSFIDGKKKGKKKGGSGSTSSPRDDTKMMAQMSVYTSAVLLVKLSETIRTIVQHADIYEEEDFVMNAYSFSFCPEIGEEDVKVLLKCTLQRSDAFMNDENVKGLRKILNYQSNLFDVCTAMAKMSTATVRSTATDVQTLIQSSITHLEQIRKMNIFLLVTTDNDNKKTSSPIQNRTFDTLVNRHLLGNAPVRKIKSKPLSTSISNLLTITSELNWALCDLLLKGSTLGRMKRMLHRISISSCNILTRSLIVLNLYFDDLLLGQYKLGPLIAQHMHQVGGAPRALTDSDHGINFLNRLAKPVYDTLKVLLLNRNRQRGYIDALMLREWSALQREASGIDYYFREEHQLSPDATPPFMTNYVLSTTIWIMEHYLGLALELQLFHGHYDYAIAYWYWDFLLSTQLNMMTVMKNSKLEREAMELRILHEEEEERAKLDPKFADDRQKKKKGKGGKKGSSSSSNGSVQQVPSSSSTNVLTSPEDSEDGIELMLLGLRRTLCRGIVRFIAALYQAKILHPPKYQFTSHKRRFQKRFESFASFQQPPYLTYDDFLKGSDFSNVTQDELLSSASDCFKAGKNVVDKLLVAIGNVTQEQCYLPVQKSELMCFAKVCVGNSLFLHKLSQKVQCGGTVCGDVSFDFEAHKQYCSIKIM